MGRYLTRRFIQTLILLLFTSALTFGLMSAVVGDPVLLILGSESSADQATIARMRTQLGLNEPLPVQYADWLRHAVTGDLGRSFRSPISVREALLLRLPVTVELTAMALVLAIALAIPLGVLAALRPGSRLDVVLSTMSLTSLSIPNFWLGILLIFLFALKLHWLPSAGFEPLTKDPLQNLRSMALPAVTLAAAYVGSFARFTRSSMVEVLSEDYVRTARAKGLPWEGVVRDHALRNALLPVVTVVGVELAGLFGGAVVTETVFALPGVGTLLTESVLGRDLPMVQGIVLFVTTSVILVSLIVDLLYGVLDPRMRLAHG